VASSASTAALSLLSLTGLPVLAQTVPAAPAAAASAPAPAPAGAASAAARRPVPAAAPAPDVSTQRVEVTGGRDSDTEARRRSTAAKIVIGREEIEKFGDATVGEVLRRLPGVTTPGAPGRGGPPRLRGLGNGFTQMLIDGQRLPPGFSLESLSPEQIERIEILRAPTAETGARAIAGTINIITREGFKRRLNDVRVSVGSDNGQPQGGLFWTYNNSLDKLTYTLNAGLFGGRRHSNGFSDSWVTDSGTGAPLEERHTTSRTRGENAGMHLGGRLQWRLGEAGDTLTLMPGLFANRGESRSDSLTDLTLVRRPIPPYPEYAASSHQDNDNKFFSPRLMLQYRQRVGEWRLEGGGSLNGSRGETHSASVSRRADASVLRTQDDHTVSREKSFTLNGKASKLLGPEGSEHSLVTGGELDSARRNDTRTTLQDGLPALLDFGDDFQASTLRVAAYAQDEWTLNPHLSLHAGLRWEGINTRGDDGQGNHPENRNSVWTPLVHMLWKPDPAKRDQVRISLTRSWRAPGTAQLIGRPNINRLADTSVQGSSTEALPDSAGNPKLRPELARGIDVAFERFLDGGGLLSANVFRRNLKDLMRSRVELETVSWSTYQRYVRRMRNIGGATVEGIELEAKFRADQVFESLAPVELRANLALLRSKVDGVPGPDNRLDDQAKAAANLGADYRFRGTPLTLGGNFNWVPGTLTRRAADETSATSTKRQWDVFALWAFNPNLGLRLLANNVDPRVYSTEGFNDVASNIVPGQVERNRTVNGGPSYTNLALRLEMKL
jgi:iron complex outermembrane receptor protein